MIIHYFFLSLFFFFKFFITIISFFPVLSLRIGQVIDLILSLYDNKKESKSFVMFGSLSYIKAWTYPNFSKYCPILSVYFRYREKKRDGFH